MKTLLLTLIVLLLATNTFASDWSYNYLNKLYSKNPERCYDRCQTIMDIFPNEESPYFFAMKIQLTETKEEQKFKAKNTRMIKAIDYARYFEENASKELKSKIQWDTVQDVLFHTAVEIRKGLDDENLNSNIKQLDSKWEKYTGNKLKPKTVKVEKEPLVTTMEETATVTENKSEVLMTNVSFTGMPKGTENIPVIDAKSEKELLVMINKERKRLKMDTLVLNADLSRACRYHAMDMGTQNYFDHNSFDLSKGKLVEIGDTFDRIRKFYSSTFVNSENIAAGNSAASETYNQWFNSPGHYDNMFNKSSKFVGIGMAKVPGSSYEYYWVFCTAL